VWRLSEHPPEARCETLAADAFFGELAEVEGFPALYETLKATLTDLNVYGVERPTSRCMSWAVTRTGGWRDSRPARLKRHQPRLSAAVVDRLV
jgi:hypothetical protein